MRLFGTKSADASKREQLFVEKYDWLLGWALQLAHRDHSVAADLVQDTFVRFMLAETKLKTTENIEALLYTYLKYAHLAHLRRLQRYPSAPLSVAEFDSLQLGLRVNASVAEQVEMQDMLRRIAAYACWRKESAKSASVLILRFFHGYYPDEIVCVAGMRRRAVHKCLHEGREEASLYASDPGRLKIMHQADPPEVIPQHVALPSNQIVSELQKIIFASCHTECLPDSVLRERYQEKNTRPIERELLAHIVSCEHCLSLVSRLCGIAPPSDRSAEESLGPDRHSRNEEKKDAPMSDNNINQVLRIARDRVHEAYEHQPRRLTIAVNGSVVATQDVSSPWSRQEIKLSADLKPEFIEVMSEQDVCLLAMRVGSMPPDAPLELRHEIRLSEGRKIEARVQFTTVGPLVEVAYYDPLLAPAAADEEEPEEGEVEAATGPATPLQDTKIEMPPRSSWWTRLWAKAPRIALPEMSPVLASAMVFAVALTVIGVFWLRSASKPSASDLLARAVAANSEDTENVKPAVIRQKVRIRTSKRTFERAIYRDAQGHRQPKPQKLSAEDAELQTRLALANVNWEDPLSPVNYKDWHDRQSVAKDGVTRSSNGLLTLTTTASDGVVASESLTVRDRDFHPIERTVTFRNSETVEIAELDYSILPWSPATNSQFESLREGASSGLSPTRIPLPLSKSELDEAELQARLVLNQLHADVGGRIQLTRKATGIQISGIVETEQQKREFEARLESLPNVTSSLLTFQEMEVRPTSRSAITGVKVYSQMGQASLLERYWKEKGWTPEKIREHSLQLLQSSIVVGREGKEIANLSSRFGAVDPLSERSQSALSQLIAVHQARLFSALQTEENILAEAGAPQTLGGGSSPTGEVTLAVAVERNHSLCEELAGGTAGSEQDRSIELKIAEMRSSITQTRAAVQHLTADLQNIQRFYGKR